VLIAALRLRNDTHFHNQVRNAAHEAMDQAQALDQPGPPDVTPHTQALDCLLALAATPGFMNGRDFEHEKRASGAQ